MDCEEVDRIYLSGWIAAVLGYRQHAHGALIVDGCGMDMVFSVVYNLSRALFPDGFGIPCERCGFRMETPHEAKSICPATWTGQRGKAHEFYGRNGDRSGWDNDGGYALKHDSL